MISFRNISIQSCSPPCTVEQRALFWVMQERSRFTVKTFLKLLTQQLSQHYLRLLHLHKTRNRVLICYIVCCLRKESHQRNPKMYLLSFSCSGEIYVFSRISRIETLRCDSADEMRHSLSHLINQDFLKVNKLQSRAFQNWFASSRHSSIQHICSVLLFKWHGNIQMN